MASLPSFPKFDLTAFDLSKLPTVELPKLDLSKLDDRVVVTVKNAAYLTVGLGVAAVEWLDSTRRSATAVTSDAVDSLTTAVTTGVRRVTKIAA